MHQDIHHSLETKEYDWCEYREYGYKVEVRKDAIKSACVFRSD